MGKPQWHVLGAGTMGCLFAEALHRSGCRTTLVMRTGSQTHSLPVVVDRDGTRSEAHLEVVTPHDKETISHLLVTTKAYDVHDAVASVAHLVSEDNVVLLMVNGMGFAQQISAEWPDLKLYAGTTTEGAYRIDGHHIQHAGRGETRIGRQGHTEQPPPWFEHWNQAMKACLWDSNIQAALWSKLAVNCIINPLTAVHDCLNGELAERRELAAQVAILCAEIAPICHAEGFTDVATALPDSVASVIAGTAGNRSSMLQDVSSGRRTEIDYITGYLLDVAERHDLDAPHNRALLEDIKNRDF
jgi:2-dehydropantoate 2-reductase